ncbi:thiol-disulfide isomerase/thioredoxin [Prosthecobacter fusiformis]|uniref:Thiol-disulfide isomerase/thioredoxin n=1 Tax=Prosthecobacter fusiformis TaxID=48464 RepID=A0A4R7S7B7_9BACT|nr:carboxypeptidase regulatory-like domain-containing protein [Prosthecobacter fusiformis]TDU73117.1 thiol-disulfide isomerase/thioredoxin [Prosthecobacter fusiformis]
MKFAALLGLSVVVLGAATEPGPVMREVEFDCAVVSAAGVPSVDSLVYVCHPNSGDHYLNELVVAQGKTDEQGRFRAWLKAPVHWTVRPFTVVAIAKNLESGFSHTTIHFSEPKKNASAVSIRLRETEDCRVRLLKPDGAPAAGVNVWVDLCSLPEKNAAGFPDSFTVPRLPGSPWSTMTDEDGRGVIRAVPKNARLYLVHDGGEWAQPSGRYFGDYKDAPKAGGQETVIKLVTAGSISGRITLPDGRAAGGCLIRLIEMIPYQTAYGAVTMANEEGQFELKQIPPSTYKLTYQTQPPWLDEWVGDEISGLLVSPGGATEVGDLKLSQAAIVTGKVVDAETGTPIEDPIIYRLKAGTHQLNYRFHRYPPIEYLPPDRQEMLSVTVSAGEKKTVEHRLHRVRPQNKITGVILGVDGQPESKTSVIAVQVSEYDFSPPATTNERGEFSIVITKPEGELTILAWNEEDEMADPLRAHPGGHVTLQLKDSGFAHLKGQVLNELAQPIREARIQVSLGSLSATGNGPIPQFVKTDATGRFAVPRLWTGLGSLTLFCQAEGYGGAALRDQTLKPEQVLEWNVVLKKADQIVSGIVVDSAGEPVPGVRVMAGGDRQQSTKVAITDKQGRFNIGQLTEDSVSLTAVQNTPELSRKAYKRLVKPVAEVRIVLPNAAGRVAGIITDHQGRPIMGAELSLIGRDRIATTNKEGRFELQGITEGWFNAEVNFANESGTKVEDRVRLKTGMMAAHIVMPDKTKTYLELPLAPVNLIGRPAAAVQVTAWLNSPALSPKAGGKVRILDFWGMECAPCLAGFPKVQAFWKEHQHEVEFIALSSSHYPEEEVREFLSKHPEYTFPIALLSEDATSNVDYDIRGVPLYVVIDPEGKIVSTGSDWSATEKAALRLMNQ